MRDRNALRVFDFMYEEDEMAIILNTSVDELYNSNKDGSLPNAISSRKFYGQYIYHISKSTFILISGLKKMGVTKIFELLKDAHQHKFIVDLQKDYTRFDLTSYF